MKEELHEVGIDQLLEMNRVAKSSYYAWVNGKEKREKMQKQQDERFEHIANQIREIICKCGFVPGKRSFKDYLERDYNEIVSVKRIAQVMKKMNLKATLPTKDPYKKQATHGHEATAAPNLVNQQFKQGPRKIILTDITYLVFGGNRNTVYLCTFLDAFTAEVLGHKVSVTMDTSLIQSAFDQMIETHGKSLSSCEVWVHSDQGTQYTSTTFRRLLSDLNFIQSMSRRGNSQDNSVQESFYARLKTEIGTTIARCFDIESVNGVVEGYMKFYNTKRYQWRLAGLTPHEYYLYVMTGIYPLDNYHGVPANQIMSIEEYMDTQQKIRNRKKLEKKQRKQLKQLELEQRTPKQIIANDQKRINKELRKWKKQSLLSESTINRLHELQDKVRSAGHFVCEISDSLYQELFDLTTWRDYPQLSYVNDMTNWW